MKVFNLIKSEFVKNYSLKRVLLMALVMAIAVLVLVEGTMLLKFDQPYYGPNQDNINHDEEEYQGLLQKENKTIEDGYEIYYLNIEIQIAKWIYENKIENDWRSNLSNKIRDLLSENYLIGLIQNDKVDLNTICSTKNNTLNYNRFLDGLNDLCDKRDDFALLKQNNEKTIKKYKELIQENKYYLYLQYQMDNGALYSGDKYFAQIIIDKKIENAQDYRVLNYLQYSPPLKCDGTEANIIFESKEDEEKYKNECLKENKKRKKISSIVLYSTIHDIPHDISYTEWNGPSQSDTYVTSKNLVNQVFHLSIVVIVLVAITSSGIISGEYNKGTIKNLVSSPVKRWKILLSKFIYLILHTYIIWLIGLFLIILYSGFRLGFSDLFLPKLVYTGGKVMEMNYLLYLLIQLFVSSIPVIACLSILFFLSTVTLNTAVTTSVISILGVIPLILFYICSNFHIKELIYLPFMYFDCGLIYDAGEWYQRIIEKFPLTLEGGIIISIITIVVLYITTNIIFIKRDIKNT